MSKVLFFIGCALGGAVLAAPKASLSFGVKANASHSVVDVRSTVRQAYNAGYCLASGAEAMFSSVYPDAVVGAVPIRLGVLTAITAGAHDDVPQAWEDARLGFLRSGSLTASCSRTGNGADEFAMGVVANVEELRNVVFANPAVSSYIPATDILSTSEERLDAVSWWRSGLELYCNVGYVMDALTLGLTVSWTYNITVKL